MSPFTSESFHLNRPTILASMTVETPAASPAILTSPAGSLSLAMLPTELIDHVCTDLAPRDISALSCASRLFHIILTPLVHKNIVTYRAVDGATVLHLSALSGNFPQNKLALSLGVPLEAKTTEGLTALHSAVLGGNTEILSQLLSRGADSRSKDRFGNTPLHCAVWAESVACMKLLLDAGADATVRNDLHFTVLQYAAWKGHVGAIELLLDVGMDDGCQCAPGSLL
jgi:hypothetical protein